MRTKRLISMATGCAAALTLLVGSATPAAAAPAYGVTVEVGQVDAGLEIGFYCAAAATGPAVRTEISSCRMEYRTYGWTSEASVVRNDGAFAVAAGRETGLQGGEDHWRENTWVCWDASSTFIDGSTADSSGCKQVA